MTRLRRAALTALVTACVALEARAQENPTPAADARVETILTALQNRSDGLKDIRCDVRFVEKDEVNLTTRLKEGKILFLMGEPNPRFLIHFAKTVADGIVGKQEWLLFDGQWLSHGLERLEQITKQELVRPGEKLDLFDLEKAPFPLPFGQKKDKMLQHFEIRMVEPTADDPPESDHLVCTPKPGSRLQRRYQKLELFVDRKINLPRRIVVVKNKDEVNTADFGDLSEKSINAGVSEKDFERPAAWKNYKEVVEELVPAANEAP